MTTDNRTADRQETTPGGQVPGNQQRAQEPTRDTPREIARALAASMANPPPQYRRPEEVNLRQPQPGRRPVRHRLNLNATVHADTLERLDDLSARFATSRGQLLDRLVLVLHTAYAQGKVLCITGAPCIANRTDLPELY